MTFSLSLLFILHNWPTKFYANWMTDDGVVTPYCF